MLNSVETLDVRLKALKRIVRVLFKDDDEMSITAGTNLIALRLTGQMRLTNERLSGVFERVSTGNRINRAADDPAGLVIADSLRLDSRLMSVAIRNASDAISYITVADDALGEISNLLSRMSELSIQGANGSYSVIQRSSMQLEFVALGSEIQRISSEAKFNDRMLLSGSSNLITQVGITDQESSKIVIGSAVATLDFLGLGSGYSLSYSLTGTTTDYATSASYKAFTAVQNALENVLYQRGVVGASTVRLSAAVSNLAAARDTTIAAEASVREADVAREMLDLVSLQVQQSAQTSLFAQANQSSRRVLALLRFD